MNVKERVQRMLHSSGDANIAAFANGFIFIVVLIIAVIALFLDIVYVTMIWSGLPAGFLQYIAAGGAILVSPVVILILLAKLFYFRKGGQQIFSYIAFAIDLAFAIMNTYCAFQIAWHDENSFVVGWRDLSPITPVVILALLSILLLLDPNAKRRNVEREQQEKKRDLELKFQYEEMARGMAIKELNAEFAAAQQEAAIEVRMEALEEYKKMLREELLNDETRAILREGARRVGENAIHDLTGLPRQSGNPAAPREAKRGCHYCGEIKVGTWRKDPAVGLVPICYDCMQRISAPPETPQPPATQQPARPDFYDDLVQSVGGPSTSPLAAAPTQPGNGANHH